MNAVDTGDSNALTELDGDKWFADTSEWDAQITPKDITDKGNG